MLLKDTKNPIKDSFNSLLGMLISVVYALHKKEGGHGISEGCPEGEARGTA